MSSFIASTPSHTWLIFMRNNEARHQVILCWQPIPMRTPSQNRYLQRYLFVPNIIWSSISSRKLLISELLIHIPKRIAAVRIKPMLPMIYRIILQRNIMKKNPTPPLKPPPPMPTPDIAVSRAPHFPPTLNRTFLQLKSTCFQPSGKDALTAHTRGALLTTD